MNKIYIFLLFLVTFLINVSCKFNKLYVDKIYDIEVFESYDENIRITKDLLTIDWFENIKGKIVDLNKNDMELVTISYVPNQNENKISVILKYPKDDEQIKVFKIKNEILNGIKQYIELCTQNKEYIIKSSNMTKLNMELLDKKDYATFYNNFHSKIKKDISFEKFIEFIKQRDEFRLQ